MGVIMAAFWLVGRTPSLSDALHIIQMKGNRISNDFLSRMSVGSGSNEHVFGGELRRSFRISSAVYSRNDVSCLPVYVVNDGESAASVAARTSPILSTKYRESR